MLTRATLPAVLVLLLARTCAAQPPSHQASLSWGSSTSPGATYTVKRSTVAGGPYVTVTSGLAVTSYVDKGLSAATRYCYVVTATTPTLGESANSTEACGSTSKDVTAPVGTVTIVFQ